MQGFPNEISMSEILDMVYAMRHFENVEIWLESDVCELGFQHTTDRHRHC
jgi:hypothetical protein